MTNIAGLSPLGFEPLECALAVVVIYAHVELSKLHYETNI